MKARRNTGFLFALCPRLCLVVLQNPPIYGVSDGATGVGVKSVTLKLEGCADGKGYQGVDGCGGQVGESE